MKWIEVDGGWMGMGCLIAGVMGKNKKTLAKRALYMINRFVAYRFINSLI